MAKYIVIGPCIQVHTAATDGTPVLVYRYQGNAVELNATDAKHLLSVNLIAPAADVLSDPIANPAPGTVGVPGSGGVGVPGLPADDADKAVWVAFAVSQGLTEADAQAADIADLKAIYAPPTATTAGGVTVTSSVNLLPRPADTASKAVWVTYAIAKGVPLLEAQGKTRDQLVADPRLKA